MIKQNMTILYVSDQEVAKQFYQTVLDMEPILHVPGMTEFKLLDNSFLGLMPLSGINKLLGSQYFPVPAQSTPRAELYLLTNQAEPYLARALSCGAQEILPLEMRDWGDRVGYCLDPDGHVLAFAEAK